MANLTLNVPDRLYSLLQKSAAAHRRSINSEVIVFLEQALAARRAALDVFLADLHQFHKGFGGARLTQEILDEASRRGGP